MKYKQVPVIDDDKPWLDGLRRAAYEELSDATFGGWDEARHARHFDESWQRRRIKIVEVDGERVGMVQLFEESDSVEIGEIQILPHHQNMGIGRQVLSDVIRRAHTRGKPVVLSVGLENERALRLYLRLGFRTCGQSETHHLLACGPTTRRPTESVN
jgi:ribosomal protein S18 acetylase RimI-like enzyme